MQTPTSRGCRSVLVSLVALALLFAACGDDGDGDATGSPTGTGTGGGAPAITVASFGFGESEILARIYGKALAEAGIDVELKLKLGSREIVAPALEKGEIDLVPEYVGNLLAFYDAAASKPGDDLDTSTEKLRDVATAKKLAVLEPSAAADGDVIAMTKAKATELGIEKISDLKGKESGLVMGGPSECQTRITCLKGLQDVYGLKFKEFKPLDTGGPLTVGALKDGTVQVARLFSADPALKANGFVVLEDDEFIQPAGNVVPVIRSEVLTDEIEEILDRVSAAMTTEELIDLNTQHDVDKKDAEEVADAWLEANL
jgi:osmoprotectant transport system substrate-binding protein